MCMLCSVCSKFDQQRFMSGFSVYSKLYYEHPGNVFSFRMHTVFAKRSCNWRHVFLSWIRSIHVQLKTGAVLCLLCLHLYKSMGYRLWLVFCSSKSMQAGDYVLRFASVDEDYLASYLHENSPSKDRFCIFKIGSVHVVVYLRLPKRYLTATVCLSSFAGFKVL